MQKAFLLSAFLILTLQTSAQIVNADFEDWYTDTIGKERLIGWEHLIKYNGANVSMFGTWKDIHSEHNTYALQLSRWYNYTWDIVRQKNSYQFFAFVLIGLLYVH